MTLAEIYCPPIPAHWLEAVPYVVVKELGSPDPDEFSEKPLGRPPRPEGELTQAQINKRAYQRTYSMLNRKKLTAQKREWYQTSGRVKRKERYQKELAVRTMVAMGKTEIIPEGLRDSYMTTDHLEEGKSAW